MAKKVYIITFSLVFALVGIMSISAAAINKTAQLTFRNIKLMVDGTEFTDPNGLEPFIYEDRVYVPISTVAESLGKDVSWDGTTNTVTIKEKTAGTPSGTRIDLPNEVKVKLKPGTDEKEHSVSMTFALELTDAKHAQLISEKESSITGIAAKMIENLDYETISRTDITSSIENYMKTTSNQILGGDYISRVFVTSLVIE